MQTKNIDPKALTPGTLIRHSSGGTFVLKERKADDSGWWMEDGGGLYDGAWNEHGYTEWEVLGPRCPTCHGAGFVDGGERGVTDGG